MKITYIQTEDGRTKVEWWPKEKFRNRATEIFTAHSYNRIPIPDDVVLCDFCNKRITEFPVPVAWGTYALCAECLEGITREGGENSGR